MLVRTYCYVRKEEPIADQGRAELKLFIESKNDSQVAEVYDTKSEGRRMVEKQSRDQKTGIRCAKVQEQGSTEIGIKNKRVPYTMSQIIWLTDNQHRLDDQRPDG